VSAPVVVAHAPDLLFSSRIGETARRLGYGFRAARTLDDLRAALAERPALVMLDLGSRAVDPEAALGAIEAAGGPAPVVAWTTHVLWKETKRFHPRCDRVVTRETLTQRLPELLSEWVEARPTGPASGASSAGPAAE
jgi:hypothetical protein